MPKGVEQNQLQNSGTATGMSSGLYGQAGNLYGSLAPTLQTEAAHPAGYSPTQIASMNTAAQQSAGGSNAGAAGQGALLASRTKNAGTADAAIGQSTRQSGQNLSKAAVDTQLDNANLQQKQQQQGISGEEGLYGTDLGASQTALGLSNSALTGAAQSSSDNIWNKVLLQAMSNAQKAGDAGAAGG